MYIELASRVAYTVETCITKESLQQNRQADRPWDRAAAVVLFRVARGGRRRRCLLEALADGP